MNDFTRILLVIALGVGIYLAAQSAGAALDVSNGGGATNVNLYGATLRATCVATGSANPQVWIYWGPTDNTTNRASWSNAAPLGVLAESATGSTNVFPLTSGQVYYYRAWASNATEMTWATNTTSWTTKQVSVSTETVMTDTNGVLKTPTNLWDANSVVRTDALAAAGAADVLTDGSRQIAYLLVYNSANTGANVIADSAFDTTNGWAFSGNCSLNSTASNATFASGGAGTLTTSTNIPTGIYIFERYYNHAGGTNVVTWSTGLATGTDTVSAAAGYTNIVAVSGPLSLTATPSDNIYADGIYLTPYTGAHVTISGDVRANNGLFNSASIGTNSVVTSSSLTEFRINVFSDVTSDNAPAASDILTWNGSSWSNSPYATDYSYAAASNSFVLKTGEARDLELGGVLTVKNRTIFGVDCVATEAYSAVSGGIDNSAAGQGSAVAGGRLNSAAGQYSTAAGGRQNSAAGVYSMAAGGYNNSANGSASFAAGYRAKATNDGAFVWADFVSMNKGQVGSDNSVTFHASGGFSHVDDADTLTSIDGALTMNEAWSFMKTRIVTNIDFRTITPPTAWHGAEMQDVGATQRLIRAFGSSTNDWVQIFP